MKNELKFIEEIDRFLDGSMTEQEQESFKNTCREDPAAQKLFEEHHALRRQIKQRAERAEIKETINNSYYEWKAVQKRTDSSGKLVFLWKAAAVAAGLALIISIGGLWLTMNRINNHKTSSYTILRREIDNIKRSQKDLRDDLQSSNKPVNPGQYGGTGFAISNNGYIATNAHVIKGADSIHVVSQDGRSLKARIVYQDTQCDLAVLKVEDSTFKTAPLPFALSSKAAPLGEEVYTLGYPRNEIVYGKGYISAETGFRGDSASYQLTLPVNPGNSGGPLVDEQGYILGIISGKQSASDNIAFAVKSTSLLDMIDSLPKDFPKKALRNPSSPLRNLSRINQIKKLEQYVFLVKVFN